MHTIAYRPELEVPGRKGDRRLDNLTLKRGQVNHFTDGQLAQLQQHSTWQKLVAWGAVEIVTPDKPIETDENSVAEDLSGYSQTAAIKLIELTRDLEVLERWQQRESQKKPPRRTIMERLNLQISEVKTGLQGI